MKLLWLLALAAGTAMTGDVKPPAQAARGETLFFDENAPAHCGGCHSLAKKGNVVGPDISRLARLSPRAIIMAIRATRTQYVQVVRLKSGGEFPGMPGAKDDTTAQYYDLSATPPALRKLNRDEISSIGDNATWKHPPESAGYTAKQLADVIAYIKWASYGDTKSVNPADVE